MTSDIITEITHSGRPDDPTPGPGRVSFDNLSIVGLESCVGVEPGGGGGDCDPHWEYSDDQYGNLEGWITETAVVVTIEAQHRFGIIQVPQRDSVDVYAAGRRLIRGSEWWHDPDENDGRHFVTTTHESSVVVTYLSVVKQLQSTYHTTKEISNDRIPDQDLDIKGP